MTTRVGAVDAPSTVPLITSGTDIVVLSSVLVASSPLLRLVIMTTTVAVVEVVLQVDRIDGYEVGVARPCDELEVVGDGEVSNAVPAGVDGAQQADGWMIQLPYLLIQEAIPYHMI